MIRYGSLSLIMIAVLLGASHAAHARELAIVVAAAHPTDAPSRRAADALRDGLRTAFHVIDPHLVDHVVSYYGEQADAAAMLPEAHAALARAQEHYFHMRYEEAQAEARRAVKRCDAADLPLHERGALLFDSLMTLMMAARAADDGAAEQEALNRAARLAPASLPRIERYPPSVAAAFRGARDRMARRGAGDVEVGTDPPAAEVFLNGIACGVSPVTLSGVPAGSYALMIRTNNYRTVRRQIEVEAGGTVRVGERLRWRRGGNGRGRGAAHNPSTRDALHLADLLKADRAVVVAAHEDAGGGGMIRARIGDRAYRAGHRPIVAHYDAASREQVIAAFHRTVAARLEGGIAANPREWMDPGSTADPLLMGSKQRRRFVTPLAWGAVGAAVAGALAGGIMAALDGGGADTGSIRVRFR